MKINFETVLYYLGLVAAVWVATSFGIAICIAIHSRRERRALCNRRLKIREHLYLEPDDETLCPDDRE